MTAAPGWMLCQACGARNPGDRDYCSHCQQKLLVVSGVAQAEETAGLREADPEEAFSFDEHLLERISILEEAVKRSTETLQQLLDAFHKQERSLVVSHAGWSALRDLLERKRLIGGEEWQERWSTRVEHQLGVLERRRRFAEVRARAVALYRGKRIEQFHGRLEEAEQALLDLDVDRSHRALVQAFRLDRRNAPLALLLGETLFNEGNSRAALGYFRHVLDAEPGHYEALVYTAVIHHEGGEGRRAVELLERAVELFPDAFLPRFSLGVIHADQGDLDRAVAQLERAVALDPVPQAQFFLGKCQYERGRQVPAIRHLEAAVRRDGSLDEAFVLLGLAYLDRRWSHKALAAFRQAQELRPRRMQYHDLVRSLTGQAGSPLPRVRGKAGEWLSRAEGLFERGHAERALACYRRALSLDPDHPTLLVSYAVACLELGRNGEAEVAARRVLEREADEMLRATAFAALMEALRAEGRGEEGNRVGRRLLAELSSPFARTIAYYEMALNLAQLEEELDRALDHAQRAAELAPDELKAFPLAALGWVHHKRGEHEQAVGFLTRAAELAPSASTLTQLGLALLAAGEPEPARKVLAEARRLGGRGPSLERKMIDFLKDSRRLLERVQERQARGRPGAARAGEPAPP